LHPAKIWPSAVNTAAPNAKVTVEAVSVLHRDFRFRPHLLHYLIIGLHNVTPVKTPNNSSPPGRANVAVTNHFAFLCTTRRPHSGQTTVASSGSMSLSVSQFLSCSAIARVTRNPKKPNPKSQIRQSERIRPLANKLQSANSQSSSPAAFLHLVV